MSVNWVVESESFPEWLNKRKTDPHRNAKVNYESRHHSQWMIAGFSGRYRSLLCGRKMQESWIPKNPIHVKGCAAASGNDDFVSIFGRSNALMKKIILLLTAIFTIASCAFAQLELTNIDANITGYIDVPEDDEIEGHVTVVNTSDEPLTLRVYRQLLSHVEPWNSPFTEGEPGARERFCWGPLCYDYGQPQTSPNEALMVTIEPGGSDDSFYGYYEHRGVPGITEIRYCFFDHFNPDTEICQDIVFNVEQTQSVGELEVAAELGNVAPNPVNGGLASVAYNFGNRAGSERKFVIYNMVGNIVNESLLNQPNGVVLFNSDTFSAGVYFYALVENGAVLQTKKFVVSK